MPRLTALAALSTTFLFALACQGRSDEKAAAPPSTAAAAPRPAVAPMPEIDAKSPLPDPLPEVAAVVNGHTILSRHVKTLAESAIKQQKIPVEQRALIYRRALQHAIARELLLEEATARGLSADDQKLQAAENEARAAYPDAKAFHEFLAQQGMDEKAFKTELRRQFTINALTQQEADKIKPESITDDELLRYYEANAEQFTQSGRVKVAHIFVRVPRDVTPARRHVFKSKAEGLLLKVRGGADFGKVAEEHSDDVSSRGRGGVMDVFGRGEMTPELKVLEDTAQSLSPGQVSNLIESGVGFHILKLLERLPDDKTPLEKVKEPLRNHLVQQKRSEGLQQFIGSLRAKAKIETHL